MGSSSTKPNTVTRVRKSPGAEAEIGGELPPFVDELKFTLEDPTSAGLESQPGMQVVAVPHRDRVAVEHQVQILGWVPNDYAERIREGQQNSIYQGIVDEVNRAERIIVVRLQERRKTG